MCYSGQIPPWKTTSLNRMDGNVNMLFLMNVVITPHVSDVMGVIVLALSVCLCVRLVIGAEWTGIRT